MVNSASLADARMHPTTTGVSGEKDLPGPAKKVSPGNLEQDIEALIPRLRRYARALTRDVAAADDLVQETLARALAKLHLWQRGTNLRAWLFTILHHRYVTHIRRSAREGVQVDIGGFDQMLKLAPAQIDHLELRDLERVIAELPASQRTVILLVGLEGLEYDEVSAMLKVPLGTVRSRIARARETLRIRIGRPAKARRPECRPTARTRTRKSSFSE